jgi:hypothetical protein
MGGQIKWEDIFGVDQQWMSLVFCYRLYNLWQDFEPCKCNRKDAVTFCRKHVGCDTMIRGKHQPIQPFC